MPQMAPMFWTLLFNLFLVLLILSMVKLFYSSDLKSNSSMFLFNSKKIKNWQW